MSAEATIQSLRSDIALHLSRIYRRSAETQVAFARRLGIPQPTLSKINSGRVHDLSIEFLLRVATRVGLALTLQTGRDAKEAGAFVSGISAKSTGESGSRLATEARRLSTESENRLTPTQRLEAFLEHNQLVAELHQAARAAERKRTLSPPYAP